MTWPRLAVPAILLTALLAGCAESAAGTPPASAPSPTATTTHGERPDDGDTEQPPPFEVRYDDDALVLYAYTFCYDNGCADGFDENPPSIGSPAEIYVYVPVFSELSVSQITGDHEDPGRTVQADVEPVGDGWWRVTPGGPADTYVVTLFASGDGTGDMVADVRWKTPGP